MKIRKLLNKKLIKVYAIHEVNGRSEINQFFILQFLFERNEQAN